MKKSRRKRRRRSSGSGKERRQQETPPIHEWRWPFPPLQPEDRLSTIMDYRDIVTDYDQIAAEVGEDVLQEELDYFYFFLTQSHHLTEEPEFKDVDPGIDPYDFLIYEAYDFFVKMKEDKFSIWAPEGGLVSPYEHIVMHAFSRYLTPRLHTNLKRRVRRIARRCRATGTGAMADAVAIAMEDEGISPLMITLLQQLFSKAILQGVLDLPEQHERDWEKRDRSLDSWMKKIANADFDQPANEAIEKLAAAGPRALPQVDRLFYDPDTEYYTDYPVVAAIEIAGRIPSQRSLRLLLEALLKGGLEEAYEQLVKMPDLVCPYLAYALTVPDGPDWDTALWGYALLGKVKCPGALDLLVEGLAYQGEKPYEAEGIQLSAADGLLDLGDERAIPILHDYLRNPQADLGARDELLYKLTEHNGGHPWAVEIVGDLTPETLPGLPE